MKKRCLLLIFFAFLQAAEDPKKFYQDINPDKEKRGWDIGFDNISLNFSSTSINNQTLYQNFSSTYFQGSSQIVAEGNLFFHSNFYAEKFVIFNILFAEYGRSIIYPTDEPKTDNTTLDRIYISTDYTQRLWNFPELGGFDVGPFVELSYQTQFARPETRNRTQILNVDTGIKLFDAKYIKSFSMGVFGQDNFTYTYPVQGAGFNLEFFTKYPFNPHTAWSTHLNFRHYWFNNYPRSYSPQIDLELTTKIDAAISSYFSVAPFINFYLLKGSYLKTPATSLIIGVSLSYQQSYHKPKIYVQKTKKEETKQETSKKEEASKSN